MLDDGDTETLSWAIDTVRGAVDRGARFVLPPVLEIDDSSIRAAVRMTLTVPTPAIVEGAPDPSAAAPSGPPPAVATDAITYLAVWVVGASLVAAHRRLGVDDAFAVELREVQGLLRRAVRPS